MAFDILRHMARNRKPKDKLTAYRVRQELYDRFEFASEAEGFQGNVTAWMLFHLEKLVKRHESDFLKSREQKPDAP